MYGFGGVGLSEVQISISELSVVGGWWWVGGWTRQTHFMVGPSQGPTKTSTKQEDFFSKTPNLGAQKFGIWVPNILLLNSTRRRL